MKIKLQKASDIGPVVRAVRKAAQFYRALQRFRDLHNEATVLQVQLFLLVTERPGIAQSDLYTALGVSDSAASRILAFLSEIGGRHSEGLRLIAISVNPNDRRERTVTLTTKGQRLADDVSRDIAA